MPKTRVSCPNCRQPIMADVNQLFDASKDPQAKQMILANAFNLVKCPNCGYQGNLATPIVYHDPDKELLLTYFPPELGMPVNDQERVIGPIITQVMNSLPQEKRKAYLFRPQTMLTVQHLQERILEGDGITHEMIQDQQKRLQLLQRLMDAKDDSLPEIAKNEDALIDREFFNLLARLLEVASVTGDQTSAQRLQDLQKKLLPLTTFGRSVQEQTKEVESALQSLQALGKDVTPQKLLDVFLQAPNDTRLSVLVTFARSAIDYNFFQVLTDKIDKTQGDERQKLVTLRDRLLDLTRKIDQEMEGRLAQARQVLEAILKADDIEAAATESLPAVDDFFVRVLEEEMETARKKGELDRIGKLQKVLDVLQAASTPPEYALVEELLDAPDEKALRLKLQEHKEEVTPDFLDAIAGLLSQVEQSGDKETTARLQMLYQTALRFSMEMNLTK